MPSVYRLVENNEQVSHFSPDVDLPNDQVSPDAGGLMGCQSRAAGLFDLERGTGLPDRCGRRVGRFGIFRFDPP